MNIRAVKCRICNNIIYSRSKHDFRTCDCGRLSIDGFGERVISKDYYDYEDLILDGDVLLKQVLEYDYKYGNKNIPEENVENGWQGKYRIDSASNPHFFDKLVIKGNWRNTRKG